MTSQREIYQVCIDAGWDPTNTNTFAEEIAHLHEEVSEAFRAWRLHQDAEVRYEYPDGVRTRPFRVWDYDAAAIVAYYDTEAEAKEDGRGAVQSGKPIGIPPEFGDVLIGLFYNAERLGFDLLEEMERKLEYNRTRDYVAEGRQLHT